MKQQQKLPVKYLYEECVTLKFLRSLFKELIGLQTVNHLDQLGEWTMCNNDRDL